MKKKPLEIIDANLIQDFNDMKKALVVVDHQLSADAHELAKKWGHPIQYDDAFHVKQRERMRRIRNARLFLLLFKKSYSI